MKLVAGVTLALLLVACVSPKPSNNPICQEDKDANLVLGAARQFVRMHGRNPASLSELVPTFLTELPERPSMSYDAATGELHYQQEYLNPPNVNVGCGCDAKISGRKQFFCLCDYY